MPKTNDAIHPTRRRFTDEYKLRIVEQYDTLTDPHERGALLRREGLYTSHIALWRKLENSGRAPSRRGRKPKSDDSREVERLRKQVKKLEFDLDKANKIIDVQGKVSALLHQLADKSQAEQSEH
ncbi:MAG TPA: hypothetical protein VKT72_05700 [Candidatus Baltobacteraceae bacterium]|nr:hypothetical protein [Candidatus Baltobacteraceae bacterium]